MAAQTYNPSAYEVEAGGEQDQSQSRLVREPLSQENQNQTKPKHQLIVWRILEEEELLFLCEVVILGHPSFS